ncbi:hypothetical protein ACRRTK_008185 [Alexandromys fortis]
MPGVTVKVVNQQEFVRALAAFLIKSGKLKVPNGWRQSSWPNIKSLLPMMRTGSTHELLLQHGTCTCVVVPGALEGLKMVGKDQDGQDCQTGGSCQQEASEQKMLG